MSIVSRIPLERSSSFGAGSFGIRKLRKIDSFSHSAFVYGRIAARKPYVRTTAFALPLKLDLAALVQLCAVGRDTPVEHDVEPVAVGAAEVEPNELVHLRRLVDPGRVEVGLQVMEFVRVGLVAEDRRPVVRRERPLDRV